MVCVIVSLSLNGRISAYFGNIHTKFSKRAYFEIRFHSILSKCEISRSRFL